jgi:PKD repeat protein
MEKIKNMNKFWFVAILAPVLLFSCRKKDFPETVSPTESNFYFNGTIDGNPISLKAGISKYYMYSSHTLNANNLYSFIADLKPEGCNNCNNSLQITINDFKYSTLHQGIKIDSSLAPKFYPILGAPYYAVQFKSSFNHQAGSYLWDFGDNTTSRQANPLHIYNTVGNYKVSLRINSTNGCQQYITNIEKIEYQTVNPNISAVSHSTNTFRFKASLSDSLAYTYFWDFGDGDISNLSNPLHTYATSGTYPVKLRIINTQMDTLYARYNIATQTSPMPCLTNYSIESITQVSNSVPVSNIIINWTDENGDVYTSDSALQPSTSNFKIVSVEDYEANEKGEKTKKIKVKFNCQVYNGTRMKIINDAEGVLCVSYR